MSCGAVSPDRRPGERSEYALYVEARYLAAERATNGHLIKPEYWGLIDPARFFWRRGRAPILAASDELLEHFGAAGWPLTFSEWCQAKASDYRAPN